MALTSGPPQRPLRRPENVTGGQSPLFFVA